jgi:hypothetical protein
MMPHQYVPWSLGRDFDQQRFHHGTLGCDGEEAAQTRCSELESNRAQDLILTRMRPSRPNPNE